MTGWRIASWALVVCLAAFGGAAFWVLAAGHATAADGPPAASAPATGAAPATAPAGGRTYYVDFAGGSDQADGLSAQTAFNRCPGDPAAEAQAKAAALAAGDTVLFKGGVVYRGEIRLAASGRPGAPIRLDGNSGRFGAGRAILDGSERLGGWAPCASAEQARGSPHWKDILVADAPAGITVENGNLYQGQRILAPAQDPNPRDPVFWDLIDGFHRFPGKQGTQTSVSEPNYFQQTEPNAWDGAMAALWIQGNVIRIAKLTGYDPASHTIRFARIPNGLYDDGRLAMLNALSILDSPGEYAILPDAAGRMKVYLWPPDGNAPARDEITYSRRATAIDVNGQSHVAIQGFLIERYCGHFGAAPNRGVGVAAEKGGTRGLAVRGVEVRYCDKHWFAGGHQAGIVLTGAAEVMVEDCLVRDNRRCGGIYMLGGTTDATVRNSRFLHNGMQPIWVMGGRRCKVLGNHVEDNLGTHSNGISVYLGSSQVLVRGNRVFNSNIAFTSQESNDVTVERNIFHTASFYAFADWSRCKDLKVFNNTILRDDNTTGITIGPGTTAEVKNNILSNNERNRGLDADHNLRVTSADWATVFVDAARRDFRLRPGSPAIDAGLDVGDTADIAGAKVPQGKAPDVGAYEFAPDK